MTYHRPEEKQNEKVWEKGIAPNLLKKKKRRRLVADHSCGKNQKGKIGRGKKNQVQIPPPEKKGAHRSKVERAARQKHKRRTRRTNRRTEGKAIGDVSNEPSWGKKRMNIVAIGVAIPVGQMPRRGQRQKKRGDENKNPTPAGEEGSRKASRGGGKKGRGRGLAQGKENILPQKGLPRGGSTASTAPQVRM